MNVRFGCWSVRRRTALSYPMLSHNKRFCRPPEQRTFSLHLTHRAFPSSFFVACSQSIPSSRESRFQRLIPGTSPSTLGEKFLPRPHPISRATASLSLSLSQPFLHHHTHRQFPLSTQWLPQLFTLRPPLSRRTRRRLRLSRSSWAS